MAETQTTEPVVTDQTVTPAPEPPAAEPAAQEQPPHGNAGKTPWYMTRISEESAARRQAEEKAAAAERRAAEAEALAQRQLQPGADGKPQPTPAPTPPASNTDRQAEISREATRQRFYEDTVDVRNRGIAQYGAAFTDTLNILGALGATTNEDFIADVFAVDKPNAHAVLKQIAADPDKAVALTQMTSRQRIAELTRMTMAATKTDPAPSPEPKPAAAATPPRRVSNAPAPAPAVQSSTSKAVDWRADDASEEEFQRGWEETMAKRTARR